MPKPSLLRIVKRWRRYEPRESREFLRPITRGVYVLYREVSGKNTEPIYHTVYIGVAGVAKEAKSGIGGRLQSHRKHRTDWTHYSFFEVHDNVTREEILELESLFLTIFRHDPRIQLENKQKDSTRLYKLRGKEVWSDVL
jgi:hypothetical protein